MKLRILSAALSVAAMPLLSAPVSAQTGAGGQPAASRQASETNTLTLEQAIRQAMEKNYTVRALGYDVRRSELEVDRANAGLLPSVNANAGYDLGYSLNSEARRTSIFGVDPAANNRYSYGIGSSLNLFNGGSDAARIRGSEFALEASRRGLQWTRQQIAFAVTGAYVDALRTRELVGAAEKTLAESRAQLERVKGLNTAGSVPVAQVYQQEAVVGQNELSLIQAQNNYENAKADLLVILDIDPNDHGAYGVNLTGIDTTTSSARQNAVRAAITDAAIDRVLESRADIVAARARVDAAEEQIAMTRGALLPSLDLNVGVNGGGAHENPFLAQSSNGLNAGLSLQVPIFDRMQNRIAIEQQQLDIEADLVRIREQEQSVRSDVAKAANNLRSSEQALQASERALRSAEESLRLAQERLRVGAGIQLDVIIAQSQVETARTNRVNAIYNYVLAAEQIEFTLGQWNY
ncbi:MAG TPA: TolC family protein [Candidatus Kapabacteria bacterium]|nr:TolC family protein [Candidatus Kapabacteria bacterium]